MDNDVFEEEKCLKCSILPICGGGCPLNCLRNTEEKQDTKKCSHFKKYLPDFLKSYYILNT